MENLKEKKKVCQKIVALSIMECNEKRKQMDIWAVR